MCIRDRSLEAGNTYQFDQAGPYDALLYLRDSSGNEIAYDDQSGGNNDARLIYTITETGTYYLDATSWLGEHTGTYTLSASLIDNGAPDDDYAGDTSTTGSLGVGETVSGQIESSGDHDWFRMNLDGGTTYQISAGSDTEGGAYFSLYDSSGNLISTRGGDSLYSDSSTFNLNSYGLSGGTYYFGITGYSGTGEYAISLNSEINGLDDFSNNTDTIGVIVPEILGSSSTNWAQGSIDYNGDSDWFEVTLESNYEYSFGLLSGHVYGDLFNDLYDPVLRLYDQEGNFLTANDDRSNSSLESAIYWTASSSGTYYLEASAYNNQYTGNYLLTSYVNTINEPLPDGFSTQDGYGDANVELAFESLTGNQLDSVSNLGGDLWGLDMIGAPEVWNYGYTGEGITVAVIDTGVDLDHPEFAGRIVGGWDFVDNDAYADDEQGHGTHVAGTIAGANDLSLIHI